jgi:hypothetical protein
MKEHNLDSIDFELDEIESIELIGEEDTIDITVEETHMFYANDIYTHNSSLSAEVVEANQMGGSIKKGQIGHFIVSIAKTLDQKDDDTATMAILKSRFGKDGVIFKDIKFDNSRIQIDMGESKGARTKKEHSEDNSVQQQLRVNTLFAAAKAQKTKTEVMEGLIVPV